MNNKKIKNKAKEALDFAKSEAKTAKSWIEFHNAVFGIGGKCSDLFPTEAERVAFCKTDEHRAIIEVLADIREKYGDRPQEVADLVATANGKLSVRLPKSIHAALLTEAKAEGISLNQLCLAKLTLQLRAMV